MKKLLLLLSLISAHASASTQGILQSADAVLIQDLKAGIERWFKQYEAGNPSFSISWLDGNVTPLLHQTFEDIFRPEKVFVITPEIQKVFGINKALAFYIPALDYIFITPTLEKKRLLESVLHETIHAFQYRYRFPLDASLLLGLSKKNRLSPEALRTYLNYYYEAQANWYVMTGGTPDIWKQWLESKYYYKHAAIDFVDKITFLASHLLIGFYQWIASDEPLILPKNEALELSGYGVFPSEWEWDQLLFSARELIVQKHYLTPENWGAVYSVTLEFHAYYAQKIEHEYFGEISFLFDEHGVDQKNFVALHDQFYEKILTADVNDLKKCERLFSEMNAAESPYYFWLNINSEQIKSCPLYQDIDPATIRNFYETSGSRPNSPFETILRDGTEGTSPSLDFLPQFEILPD